MENLLLFSRFLSLKPDQISKLNTIGVQVSATLTPEVNAIFTDQFFLEQKADTLPKLKFVQVATSHSDLVDVNHPNFKQAVICGSRGVFNIPMAEYVLGHLLSIYRHFSFYSQAQANQQWRPSRHGEELTSKKVAVIGLGQIGLQVAKTLRFMGCEVDGFNRRKKESVYVHNVYPLTELENKIANYEMVIVCLALTQETIGLLSSRFFEQLSTNAIFISVSRAEVCDEQSLRKLILEKRIRHVVLDTFFKEPLPKEDPLWVAEILTITPHISFTSPKNLDRMFEALLTNLTLFQQGERPINLLVDR